MKMMNILLLPFMSLALASCVTTKMKSSSVDEKIYSILYQPQDQGLGQVYAIGEKYDYQIKACQERYRAVVAINQKESSNTLPSNCQKSLEFILKHKDEMKEATLDFALTNASSSIQVHSGAYNAFFLRDKVNSTLIQEKNSTIQDLTIEEISKFQLSNERYVKISIPFEGEVVQLSNKAEILKLGQLRKPLIIRIPMKTWTKSRSIAPVLKGTAAIALAPVALVMLVPYVAIIGHCESRRC